jgi:hypothetical protein
VTAVVVAWWLVVAGGLIPTSWFLYRFRPAWPIREPSLIVNGMVFLAWINYLRPALVVAASGGVPRFPSAAGAVISIVIGAAADYLLIRLLVAFLRYRKQWQARQGKGDSPS